MIHKRILKWRSIGADVQIAYFRYPIKLIFKSSNSKEESFTESSAGRKFRERIWSRLMLAEINSRKWWHREHSRVKVITNP